MILSQLAENVGKYILEVESWENDADHYQTNYSFYHTKEEAKAVKQKLEAIKREDTCISDDLEYLIGGYQYESGVLRVYERSAIFFIDPETKTVVAIND